MTVEKYEAVVLVVNGEETLARVQEGGGYRTIPGGVFVAERQVEEVT